MKKLSTTLILLLVAVMSIMAQTPEQWAKLEKDVNFYVANDLGRNGYYDQKPIAELMGRMAETVGIECVAAPGDVHHFEGVRSTQDPLWMTNYELIYSHPELMLDWYPTLGNHEYRGNTQAVLDYTNVSARWAMPARYYTKVIEDGGVTVRLVFIDTAPMIDKYRNDTEKYPDAGKQDYNKQLEWLDSVLSSAKEDWVIVLGHHPVYADTGKDTSERGDMQARLNPILTKHKKREHVYMRTHTQLPAHTQAGLQHRLRGEHERIAEPSEGEGSRRNTVLQRRDGLLAGMCRQDHPVAPSHRQGRKGGIHG